MPDPAGTRAPAGKDRRPGGFPKLRRARPAADSAADQLPLRRRRRGSPPRRCRSERRVHPAEAAAPPAEPPGGSRRPRGSPVPASAGGVQPPPVAGAPPPNFLPPPPYPAAGIPAAGTPPPVPRAQAPPAAPPQTRRRPSRRRGPGMPDAPDAAPVTGPARPDATRRRIASPGFSIPGHASAGGGYNPFGYGSRAQHFSARAWAPPPPTAPAPPRRRRRSRTRTWRPRRCPRRRPPPMSAPGVPSTDRPAHPAAQPQPAQQQQGGGCQVGSAQNLVIDLATPMTEETQKMLCKEKLNIVVVASECAPFAKTGGLGGNVALQGFGLIRMVVMPRYKLRRRHRRGGSDHST